MNSCGSGAYESAYPELEQLGVRQVLVDLPFLKPGETLLKEGQDTGVVVLSPPLVKLLWRQGPQGSRRDCRGRDCRGHGSRWERRGRLVHF